MLDQCTSAASAPAPSQARQAGRSQVGFDVDPANPDDMSFDEVFSEAVSDRRSEPSDRQVQTNPPAKTDRQKPASSRKTSERKKASDRHDDNPAGQADPALAEEAQAASTPAQTTSESSSGNPPSNEVDSVSSLQGESKGKAPQAAVPVKPLKTAPQVLPQGIDAATADGVLQSAAVVPVNQPLQGQAAQDQPAGDETSQEADSVAPTGTPDTPPASQKPAGSIDTAMQPLNWLASQQAGRIRATAAAPASQPGGNLQLASDDTQAGKPVQDIRVALPQAAPTQTGDVVSVTEPAQPASQWQIVSDQSSYGRSMSFKALVTGAATQATAGRPESAQRNVTTEQIVKSLSTDPGSLLPQETAAHEASMNADTPAKDPVAPATKKDAASVAHILTLDARTPAGQPQSRISHAAPVAQDTRGLTNGNSDASANADRLARVLYAAAGTGRSVARMSLRPPELGDVTATLRLEQGRMELKLEVASQAAREIVAGGMDRLRDSLQHQGISLDTATITVAPKAEPAAGKEHQQNWQGQDAQQQSAPHEQGGGQGQHRQEWTGTFGSEAAAPAVGAEDEPAAVMTAYAVSLNVMA